MKRRIRIRKALKITLLVLVAFIITLVVLLTFVADIQPNDLRSLATIRKVDDYRGQKGAHRRFDPSVLFVKNCE
jgi:hypothetical protein